MKYPAMRVTADKLIVGSGIPMTLKSVATGAYDPATGLAATSTTDHSCYGIVNGYPERLVDGTIIRRGDAKIILSPIVDVTPKPGDRIVAQGTTWEIVNVNDATPADVVIAYVLQVRHGA
jgi:hypothetical protein